MGDFGCFDPGVVSLHSWLTSGWLMVSAVVGFTAYGFLARMVSFSVVTTFFYINPVVAVALGPLLLGKTVGF